MTRKSSASDPTVVLLVDDDQSVRTLLEFMLSKAGYEVLASETGEDALKVSREFAGEIHLLISDIIMPGISGIELAARLAAERPGIPALFISGLVNAPLPPSSAFLPKPFSPSKLSDAIERLLAPHRETEPAGKH